LQDSSNETAVTSPLFMASHDRRDDQTANFSGQDGTSDQ
jgi:hypothetical protein